MDTETVTEATEPNLELVEEFRLEDHEEESYDPRNRNGSCSNS